MEEDPVKQMAQALIGYSVTEQTKLHRKAVAVCSKGHSLGVYLQDDGGVYSHAPGALNRFCMYCQTLYEECMRSLFHDEAEWPRTRMCAMCMKRLFGFIHMYEQEQEDQLKKSYTRGKRKQGKK